MTALAKRGRRLRILLGALICLWSAYCLLSASANLSQCLSAVSLRYQTPLDPSLAYASRVYAYQQGSAQPFWPTFWSEGSITVQVAGQTAAEPAAAEDAAAAVELPILAYDGNPRLVKPLTLLSGAWPAAQDGSACLISEALAWKLWGSTNVTGQTLLLQSGGADSGSQTGSSLLTGSGLTSSQLQQTYVVRAVYKDTAVSGLFSFAGQLYSPGWQVVELEGDAGAFPRSNADSWRQEAGLPEPDHLLNAPGLAAGLKLATLLPLIWAGILILSGLWRWGSRHPYIREAAMAVGLLLLVLFLPALLDLLPGWLIPSRWSDFGFWSKLKTELSLRADEWLLLQPLGKDLQTKKQLLGLMGALLVNLLAVGSLWRSLVVWPATADRRVVAPADSPHPVKPPVEPAVSGYASDSAAGSDTDANSDSDGSLPSGPLPGGSPGDRSAADLPSESDDAGWRPPVSLRVTLSKPPANSLWISPTCDLQGIRQVIITDQPSFCWPPTQRIP